MSYAEILNVGKSSQYTMLTKEIGFTIMVTVLKMCHSKKTK